MSHEHERILPWPLAPGASPRIGELVSSLDAEIDAAAVGEGGVLVLVELGPDDGPEFLRLTERLAELWEGRGLRTLIVDAHPARPFFGDMFGESPEGFTEILHYGLSPDASARSREGCAGQWIPAGGRWSLPLENPEEPGLSLYRLASQADRVLLLADATDAEGLLDALRDRCHYRLQLVPALSTGDVAPPPVEAAEPAGMTTSHSPSETDDDLPRVVLMDDADRPRRWPLAALILVLLLAGAWALIFGPARGLIGRGESASTLAEGRGARETYSPLPGPAELPYGSGAAETADSGASARPMGAQERAGMGEAPAALAAGSSTSTAKPAARPAAKPAAASADDVAGSPSPEPEPVTPPAKTTPRPSTPPAATASAPAPAPASSGAGHFVIRRRFEPAGAWRTLTESSGPFYVHVESYHDSALADESARRRGFQRFGFVIEPSQIGGKQWYRMLIGPFPDLPAAAAVRDSLLDQTDEDYCLLVTTTSN